MNCKRFIIVCAARTGSTLLRMMLNSHPCIRCHGEVLSPKLIGFVGVNETTDPRQYHDLVCLRDRDPVKFMFDHVLHGEGIVAVGAKIKYGELTRSEWKGVLDALLADRSVHVVHLVRENRLQRFISHKLVRLTGVSMAYGPEHRPSLPRIMISPEECMDDFRLTAAEENRFREHFRDHPLFDLTYEQLCDRHGRALNELQQFLGVDYGPLIERTVKINSASMHDIVENYAELKNALQRAGYERYLEP